MFRITDRLRRALFGILAAAVAAGPASAAPIAWTNWTSASQGPTDTASGTLASLAGIVTVTFTGDFSFAQTGAGIDYWTPDAPYLSATVSNAPPAAEMVAIEQPSIVQEIRFSEPVVNPVMAIVSLGNPDVVVTYDFDVPFQLLSTDVGYWNLQTGCTSPVCRLSAVDADTLAGQEGHGAIHFVGTVEVIRWTSAPFEGWHGFTFGVVVPEPSTWLLVTGGLVGIRASRRRSGYGSFPRS